MTPVGLRTAGPPGGGNARRGVPPRGLREMPARWTLVLLLPLILAQAPPTQAPREVPAGGPATAVPEDPGEGEAVEAGTVDAGGEGPPPPADLLDPLALVEPALRPFLVEAQREEEAGNLARAESGYRLLLLRDPSLTVAALGLARVRVAQGDRAEAAALLAKLPNDAEAVAARAALLEEDDPETAIALYQRLQTLSLGHPDPYLRQAHLLAPRDAARALECLRTYLDLVDATPDFDVVLEVALALKAQAAPDRATALLLEISERWPDLAGRPDLAALLDRIAVEQEADRLAIGGTVPLSDALRERLELARQEAARRDPDAALSILQEVVARSPRSPEAWAALGDVQAARGDVAEAERAYVAATLLEPDEGSYHARLGALLAARYGGRRHAEAEAELNAALGLAPTRVDLWYQLGDVRQARGDFTGAVHAFEAYLEAEPTGVHASESRRRLDDLTRRQPPAPALVSEPRPPSAVPDPAWQHYRIARVYRNRGDHAAARQELEKALRLAPDWPDGLLFLASLELEEGRPDLARAAWDRVLDADPTNARVLLALGELERAGGRLDLATARFREAAAAGAPEAWYSLAALAMDARRPLEARRALDAYFARSTGGLVHEPARALELRVDRTLRVWKAGIGSLLLALLTLPVAILAWRWTGSPLSVLLEREPGAWHEVARILSAIRHEVLKHNTTLLPTVADRLEAGDVEVARYAADRLFGTAGGDPGVLHKFEAYVEELERLGRRHGLRLNLRRRDPVLAPMHLAVARLRGLERRLRRARPGRVARLPGDLRAVSRALNEEGYNDIGHLVRTMCVLLLDGDLFRRVYERVAGEPDLAGHTPADLLVEAPPDPVPVRIFRSDLEDVAANLFRNALFALREELPLGERRIGIAIREEMDAVTGLEHVAIRFLDNAPRPLTEAILRGRRIERGLGLAVDLLQRHQGVLQVEGEPGWAKAVVARLPRAESQDAGDAP